MRFADHDASSSSSDSVRTVPRWTPQEHAAAWYSAVDVALFKLQEGTDAAVLRCLIASSPSVESLPRDPSVYRGLERLLSPRITSEIKERRRGVVRAVLVEQAVQRRRRMVSSSLQGGVVEGVPTREDELRLAEVSRSVAEGATAWALTLGGLV